jgi:hypothetical protein
MSTSRSAAAPDVPPQIAALMRTDGAREPVRYTGDLQPDPAYYDGRIPHTVGVHHIQVHRANRMRPDGGSGFTYNHQPFLIWWEGRFFVQFLGAPRSEHEAPTLTFLCSSPDGYAWSPAQVVFPEYRLPAVTIDGVAHPPGMSAVMHQRMGFYVAPNGRLLTLGFYGICPDPAHSPNAGNGVGRVVREIRVDGTLGEIYFIRYNRHCGFDEQNTSHPFYATSTDAGFRAACAALLADRLATLQWWEEDRACDGFFALDPGAVPDAPAFNARMVTSAGAGKAFTWYTRPDGVVVGLWKNQYSALSPDRGHTWTPIVRNRSLRTTGAKIWGQRTSDGRYAIVYNHSATGVNRFPISVLMGEDGRDFPMLFCLSGEVPARRFRGAHKGAGMHYFRGISEGSAQPPDGGLWVAYSINKEDIWVLRAEVPLTSREPALVAPGEIGGATAIAELRRWNFHLPQWASARLVGDGSTVGRVLELRDEDPCDYVQAERVFPVAVRGCVEFDVQTCESGADGLEIELQTQRHNRPVRLRIAGGTLWVGADVPFAVHFPARQWHRLEIQSDCDRGEYAVRLDGLVVAAAVAFAEPAPALERIVFRTGPWRGMVPATDVDGMRAKQELIDGADLVGDTKVAPAVFRVGGLTTTTA